MTGYLTAIAGVGFILLGMIGLVSSIMPTFGGCGGEKPHTVSIGIGSIIVGVSLIFYGGTLS